MRVFFIIEAGSFGGLMPAVYRALRRHGFFLVEIRRASPGVTPAEAVRQSRRSRHVLPPLQHREKKSAASLWIAPCVGSTVIYQKKALRKLACRRPMDPPLYLVAASSAFARRTNSPTVDLDMDYDVSVNRNDQAAIIRKIGPSWVGNRQGNPPGVLGSAYALTWAPNARGFCRIDLSTGADQPQCAGMATDPGDQLRARRLGCNWYLWPGDGKKLEKLTEALNGARI